MLSSWVLLIRRSAPSGNGQSNDPALRVVAVSRQRRTDGRRATGREVGVGGDDN
jgi:hypothetical protein